MAKIEAMKSTEDSFLVELLSPASTFLKKSIDDIDAMGLSEIETEFEKMCPDFCVTIVTLGSRHPKDARERLSFAVTIPRT